MTHRFASKAFCAAFAAASLPAGTVRAQNYDHDALEPVAALAERVPADLREAGVLVIGSDTSYAPWEYLSAEDGQTPEGIDVDFAGAMAALLDLEVDFQTSAFDSILPALGTRYDIGVSAFSITNERKKVVNFVSYVVAGADWIVAEGNPEGFDPAADWGVGSVATAARPSPSRPGPSTRPSSRPRARPASPTESRRSSSCPSPSRTRRRRGWRPAGRTRRSPAAARPGIRCRSRGVGSS